MHVFCAGMYRACSTWQYEVVSHLLDRHRQGEGLGYLTGEQYTAWTSGLRTHDEMSWKAIKSHEGSPAFSKRLGSGQALAVYSCRDLREVVFSLMHKRRLEFKDLLRQGMLHQLVVNDRFWRIKPGVLHQRYEELVVNPIAGIEEIARFLGLKQADGESNEVAARFSLQANRQRTQEFARQLRSRGVDLDDPANAQLWDNRTLLHWNHLREGQPSSWRERATRDERAILDALFGDWLEEQGYERDRHGLRLRIARRTTTRSWPTIVKNSAAIAQGWLCCGVRELAVHSPRLRAVARWIFSMPRPVATPSLAYGTRKFRLDRPAKPNTPFGIIAALGRAKLFSRITTTLQKRSIGPVQGVPRALESQGL
jgi:hypothetical protein